MRKHATAKRNDIIKIQNQWYATHAGEIASPPYSTWQAAQNAADELQHCSTFEPTIEARLRALGLDHCPSTSTERSGRRMIFRQQSGAIVGIYTATEACELLARLETNPTDLDTTRREDADASAPLIELTDEPAQPNPAEADAWRRSFGTRTPRPLRPAKQDDLFNPAPQMRLSFQTGDN